MKALSLFLVVSLAPAAEIHLRQGDSNINTAEWKIWSPRPEIAPRGSVERGALVLSGNSNPAVFGGWQYHVGDIEPGKWYRFSARYRTQGVAYERYQVLSRLDWRNAKGRRAGEPEYVYETAPDGDGNRVTVDVPAPAGAAAVDLQLLLANAPAATVWWDRISFDQIPAPAARPVRVAAVNLRPGGTHSAGESVTRFLDVIDKGVSAADIILLPEGITVVGNGKKYADVAEPVPGPTTARLGEMARRKHAWIVAGIYEREGTVLYNTAVLIDRDGNYAGKYRKVYLPREEMEGGLTPGSDYPVFRTDFGKVGIMICWDLQYTDPARALALRGAELILMPIWGGSQPLGKARAIENQVFLASSGYDYPTMIVDPNGETLAAASGQGTVAFATIDLSRRYVDSWLGNMRGRFMKEVRLDIPVAP